MTNVDVIFVGMIVVAAQGIDTNSKRHSNNEYLIWCIII